MSRNDPQFNLRIPAELRDKVVAAAKENKRSATAEILARLESTFPAEAGTSYAVPVAAAIAIERMAVIDKRVAEIIRSKMMRAIDEAIDEALGPKE